jgi:hypothetical protein
LQLAQPESDPRHCARMYSVRARTSRNVRPRGHQPCTCTHTCRATPACQSSRPCHLTGCHGWHRGPGTGPSNHHAESAVNSQLLLQQLRLGGTRPGLGDCLRAPVHGRASTAIEQCTAASLRSVTRASSAHWQRTKLHATQVGPRWSLLARCATRSNAWKTA